MSVPPSGFKIKPPATNIPPQKLNTDKYSSDFMKDLLNPENNSYSVSSSQQSSKRNSATTGGFCITKVPATQDSN